MRRFFTVFGMTQLGAEPTAYRSQGWTISTKSRFQFDAIHYVVVVLIGGTVALWEEPRQLLLSVFFFAFLK